MRVLDVGCGQGHWGQALAHVLPRDSTVVGIDRERDWVTAAQRRSEALAYLPITFEYAVGDILAIDLGIDTFDLVTCQTVLIHIDRPLDALGAMLRVLRPNGWIVCAEPNNLVGAVTFDSRAWESQLESLPDDVELTWRCELGKARLGEGFNSAGELLPGWLASLGVQSLQVYMSDKAVPVWPPYTEPGMAEVVAEARRQLHDKRLVYDKQHTKRYWMAGGGNERRFESLWEASLAELARCVKSMDDETWSSAGGALMYVVAGKKPFER